MTFVNSETGAVTVDWVVLTAALVGLGLATMGVVSSGVEDVSGDVDGQLSSTTIFTSFDQRNYSAYYLAIVAHAESLPDMPGPMMQMMRDGPGRFAQEVAQAEGYDDDTLLAFVAGAAPSADYARDMTAAFDSVDLETVTVGELATALGYNEATLQSAINNNGGTIEAYVAEKRLEYNIDITREEFLQQLADERGLTY